MALRPNLLVTVYTNTLYVLDTKYVPGSVAVVGESEGSNPQPLECSEDPEAGADTVAGLHRDEAGDLPRRVGIHYF